MMPSRTRLWHHTRLDLHLVVLLSACQIIVANCGDSRALLCRGSQAVPLTADHKVRVTSEALEGSNCIQTGSVGQMNMIDL